MVSDQTVGNILKRHGIPPGPERKKTTTWEEFIGMQMDVLVRWMRQIARNVTMAERGFLSSGQ
jgi:hypothetical protein